MLTNADFQFKPARSSAGEELVMSQSTYDGLIHSPDREVRRTAFESLTDEYLAHKNTLANNLATSVKQNVFKMRARRHDSTLAATLFEDNIPVEVFHNLIGVFRRNLPTWHRYWAIKRKALGVERLRYYDTSGRRSPRNARWYPTSRPSHGFATGWRRWATTTCGPCAGAAWTIAGWTCIRIRARWRARFRAERRARIRSS
jgi:hypothetical protein